VCAHAHTPRSRVLHEKLTGSQVVKKNSPHFKEPEGPLPPSQVPATCPYPEPARSIPPVTLRKKVLPLSFFVYFA